MSTAEHYGCFLDVFEAYFLKHHREDLTEILEEKEDVEMHYPVFVKCVVVVLVVVVFTVIRKGYSNNTNSLNDGGAKLIRIGNFYNLTQPAVIIVKLHVTQKFHN